MGTYDAIVWTPEMDALVGTMSDAKVGAQIGLREDRVRYRRIKLGISPWRLTRAPVEVTCANCGNLTPKKQKAQSRSKNLFCNHQCASAFQKRRDTDMLRYGPGWKATRDEVRQRDRNCRCCGKTPEENGTALHVHHLIPFRFGGTNRQDNLVALCDSCHHKIEAMTNRALQSILVDVILDGPLLTVMVDGEKRLHESVRGAAFPIATGLAL